VSRLVRGKVAPDTGTLLAVARTLNVPVLPLLVRAGRVPREVLDEAAAPPTPKTAPTTQRQHLAALGVTDKTDQDAVLGVIRALHAKREGDAT